MLLAFRLAWRNIWRNPRRTILTLLAVAFAAAVLVFFIALQLSSYDTMIQTTVSVYHGYAQIQREGYLEKPKMRYSFPKATQLLEEVQKQPTVKAATVRANGFALVASQTRTYGAQIVGVLPDAEKEVSTVPSLVKQGRYLRQGDDQHVVVGLSLAENLRVSVGDELTLLGQGRDGSVAATVVEIVGLFESGAQDLDRALIQMPLTAFQEVFSMETDGHSIVVKGTKLEDVGMLQDDLSSLLPGAQGKQRKLVVLRWDELIPGLKQAIELDMISGWLFYFSLVLIVTFSILNTFLMSVLERTHEFGVMLALGTRPLRITGLVILECLILILSGLILGMGLGSVVVGYFGIYGFSVPGSEEIMAKWNLPATIRPQLSFESLMTGPAVIFVVSLLASLYPAIRVCWLKPVEALQTR